MTGHERPPSKATDQSTRIDRRTSRRDLLKGAAVAPTAPLTQLESSNDPFVGACLRWVKLDLERSSLLIAWSETEARIARETDWHRLSTPERQKLTGQCALAEIDARLEVLDADCRRLLNEIPQAPFRGTAAAAASLLVVERLIQPEDHPIAHSLISRTANALLARE